MRTHCDFNLDRIAPLVTDIAALQLLLRGTFIRKHANSFSTILILIVQVLSFSLSLSCQDCYIFCTSCFLVHCLASCFSELEILSFSSNKALNCHPKYSGLCCRKWFSHSPSSHLRWAIVKCKCDPEQVNLNCCNWRLLKNHRLNSIQHLNNHPPSIGHNMTNMILNIKQYRSKERKLCS